MASIFASFTPNEEEILGATCIILWGLTAIVMVKYCVFIFFLDDNGEGGESLPEFFFGFHFNPTTLTQDRTCERPVPCNIAQSLLSS